MLFLGTLDRTQGNRTIKSHKAALVLDRQGQQINIGQLPMAVDFAVVKSGRVQQADVVGPELVPWSLAKIMQRLQGLLKRCRPLITGLADDAYATILRQRATCPAG